MELFYHAKTEQGLGAEDKHILCGRARLVGQWAMQILAACGEGDSDA